ncbi:MAG TPA: hypothetical protein VEL82_02300 [Thermoplasmata archaeon]|nr:hypothetical protein [Thermoplasmata archaeon]
MYGGPYGGGAGAEYRRPSRAWLFVGVALAAIAVVGILVLLYLDGFFGPSPYGPHPGFGLFGGFLVIFLIVWVGFMVLRIAWWSSRTQRRGYGPRRLGPDPAVMMARQRYARGEITREQFDQIMTDLGRRGRGPGGPLSGS